MTVERSSRVNKTCAIAGLFYSVAGSINFCNRIILRGKLRTPAAKHSPNHYIPFAFKLRSKHAVFYAHRGAGILQGSKIILQQELCKQERIFFNVVQRKNCKAAVSLAQSLIGKVLGGLVAFKNSVRCLFINQIAFILK